MSEKIIETRICKHCNSNFSLTEIDREYLSKLAPKIGGRVYELPLPTHCPKCRQMRRLAWRNEKNIYKRKCDITGKELIGLFSPDAPCPVYESTYWYSDKWDAKSYGQDYDPTRSFFDQWGELKKKIPMPGKAISRIMENSDYSDNCSGLKNCYLCFNTGDSEDCMYSIDLWNSSHCVDCLSVLNCHNSYEVLVWLNCHGAFFSYDVKNCDDVTFVYNSNACSHCYGCFGLENKKYHIFNEALSEENYSKKVKELKMLSLKAQKDVFQDFLKRSGYTKKPLENIGCENVTDSSRIYNSKDISHGFNIQNSEHVRYGRNLLDTDSVMDIEQWWERLSNSYESHQVGEAVSHTLFSVCCWANIDHVLYSAYCVSNVNHCFGCIWLRNASYCILNTQYTKEEYEILVPRIIERMRQDGEWGEFIPARFSHFWYNQTLTHIVFPLSKTEALAQGFTWSDYEAPFPKVEKTIPWEKLPDDITKIPDDVLNWAIECEITKKPFKIMAKELEFYRKHGLPLPTKHPDTRYKERTDIYINY